MALKSVMSRIIDTPGRTSSHDRFATLIRSHFDALYGAARRLASSDADAEDLVQEVCMKAYLRLSDLESIAHPRAWLFRVLYNVFIDTVRSHQRSPVSIAANTASVDESELAGNKRLQPEEQTERLISLDLLWSAMSILDKEQCALLALHDIDGYSIAELESLTGTPEGTIKSRLHRTRIKLGRLLQRELSGRPQLTLVGTRP
jgi:RNA polymerase sigma-70 factor (ECF subfamily)